MPKPAVDNERVNLRISQAGKAKLVRAAALRNTDINNFVTQTALREADAVLEKAAAIELSMRDYDRVLHLLENPPEPNPKLRAALMSLNAGEDR